MLSFFLNGGPFMWPILIMALASFYLIIKMSIEIFIKNTYVNGLNSILFWGILSAIFGFFAHFIGIYAAMQAIISANDISPAILARGYQVSLNTILFGLFVLIVNSVIWFVLKCKLDKKGEI